jgi:hypothetical protein
MKISRADHIDHDAAPLIRRGDVIKDNFVGALLVVVVRHRDRIADIDVCEKTDALGDLAGADIEAGNDAFRDHSRTSIGRNCRAV